MEEGLKEFFKELRAVVVSSPVPVTLRSLGRDYHSFTGNSLSLHRFGYRDTATFIREKCSDFFVLQGPASDPIVTLIVPQSLEHINKMVMKQKLSKKDQMKGKRWSINNQLPTGPTTSVGERRNIAAERPPVPIEQRRVEPEVRHGKGEERNSEVKRPNAENGWQNSPNERRNLESNAHSSTPKKEWPNIEVKRPNVENGWWKSPTERRNLESNASPSTFEKERQNFEVKRSNGENGRQYSHTERRHFETNASSRTPENERRNIEVNRPNAENGWRNTQVEQRNFESNASSSTPEKERRNFEGNRPNAENGWRNTQVEQRNFESNASSSTPEKERRNFEGNRPNAENGWRNTQVEQRNFESNASSSTPEKERRNFEGNRPNAENGWRNTQVEQRNFESNASSSTPEKERRNFEGNRPIVKNGRRISHTDQRNLENKASSGTSGTDKGENFWCGRSSPGSTRDSGRPSTSSGRGAALEALTEELAAIIHDHPGGLWALDLVKLYRERFGRELRYERYGVSSGVALIRMLEGSVFHVRRPDPLGDWRLYDVRRPRPLDDVDASAASAAPAPAPAAELVTMRLGQSICALTLDDLKPGDMIDVLIGEVYSPSHFWLLRRDDDHYGRMCTVMDAMNMYYEGPGAGRHLVEEMAVCRGLYCAARYENDWHRALVVDLQEEDSVLLRYIDYGTVGSVRTALLKPLLACWGDLPAQGLRARLAGVMPPSGAAHWPHVSCVTFLRPVVDLPLVAEVVALDFENRILEVFLVDTSKPKQVCINELLIEKLVAVPRNDSVIGKLESYLRPTFEALEEGLTPSYENIVKYKALGIDLCSIEAYSRHVLDDPPQELQPDGARYLTSLECTAYAFLLAQNYRVALEHTCRYHLQLRWQTAPGEPEVQLTAAEFEYLERMRESDPLAAALYLDRVIRARLPPSAAYPAPPPRLLP